MMNSKSRIAITINTDLGARIVTRDTVEECAQAWKEFRDERNVGARDMLDHCGDVSTDGVLTHRVHYNGRVEVLA